MRRCGRRGAEKQWWLAVVQLRPLIAVGERERGKCLGCIICNDLHGIPHNNPLHKSSSYLVQLISSCANFSFIYTEEGTFLYLIFSKFILQFSLIIKKEKEKIIICFLSFFSSFIFHNKKVWSIRYRNNIMVLYS